MGSQQLLNRIKFDDDESALSELYKQHLVKLYQYAYSFLGDKEPAEEIVNDIFIKIWVGRKNLPVITNLQVYLYVSVKNACLNSIRGDASKRSKELFIAEAYYFHIAADPSQLMIRKQLQNEILKAVDDLPHRCKLVFKMVKEDGLTCKEVAGILNLSNKTVFAQLSIALKKLEAAIK